MYRESTLARAVCYMRALEIQRACVYECVYMCVAFAGEPCHGYFLNFAGALFVYVGIVRALLLLLPLIPRLLFR